MEPTTLGQDGALLDGSTVDAIIAGEVRAELARRQISQVDLAKTIGVTRAYLKRRLAGQTAWSANDLAAIAHAIGVTIASLVGPVDARLDQSRDEQPSR